MEPNWQNIAPSTPLSGEILQALLEKYKKCGLWYGQGYRNMGQQAQTPLAKETPVEINALTDRLKELDDAYYNRDEQIVPDSEYDALTRQYRKVTGKVWMKMGGTAEHLASVTHTRPMLSLDKVYTTEELLKALPKGDDFVITPKIDGLALELRYEKGRLVQAVTRGDGNTGEDVTQSLYQAWEPAPEANIYEAHVLKLRHPKTIAVRGECFTRPEDFAAINAIRVKEGKDPFKNWRSAAGGLLRNTENSEAKQFLKFIAYDSDVDPGYLDFPSYMGLLNHLGNLGFFTPLSEWVKGRDIQSKTWDDFIQLESDLTDGFACDGLVLRVNDLRQCQKLGIGSSSPRYAIALKFASEEAETTITAIEWNATRTGRVVPTYIFAPVELMSTEVKRATGHNAEQVQNLGAGIGAIVTVSKMGDIIPKVTGLVTAASLPDSPDNCPSCQTPVDQNGPDLLCPNDTCPPKLIDLLTHMAGRDRLDINGLGESVATALVENGLIRTPIDLFGLPYIPVAEMEIDGRVFGEKRARKLIDSIGQATQKPWFNVLYSLGCSRLGHPEATAISSLYGLADLLKMAAEGNSNQLTQIDGIGPVKAELILSWLRDNEPWLKKLVYWNFNLEPQALPETGAQLADKTFVLTGTFSVPKHVLEAKIREAGGTITSSVSGSTSYLVAANGETGSSKYVNAVKKGVPIISESDLEALLSSP